MNDFKIVSYEADELTKRLKQYNCILKQYAIISRTSDLPENSNFSHYYRLVYFKSGNANIVCRNEFYPIMSGMVGFVPPDGRIHVDSDLLVETYVLSFELSAIEYKKEFEEFIKTIFPYQVVKDMNGVYAKLFEMIVREGEEKDIGYEVVAQNIFMCLLIQIMRDGVRVNYPKLRYSSDLKGANFLYEQALTYINSHLDQNIRVQDMADALGITPNYVYKIFHKRTGKSVLDFIVDTKMEFAKSYLQNPLIPIKTIAMELGYATGSHFSESFKRHVGVSPMEYRKQSVIKHTTQK